MTLLLRSTSASEHFSNARGAQQQQPFCCLPAPFAAAQDCSVLSGTVEAMLILKTWSPCPVFPQLGTLRSACTYFSSSWKEKAAQISRRLQVSLQSATAYTLEKDLADRQTAALAAPPCTWWSPALISPSWGGSVGDSDLPAFALITP